MMVGDTHSSPLRLCAGSTQPCPKLIALTSVSHVTCFVLFFLVCVAGPAANWQRLCFAAVIDYEVVDAALNLSSGG